MRKRCRLLWAPERGWHVDLPVYAMLPGTFAPVTPDLIEPDAVLRAAEVQAVIAAQASVEVAIPDWFPLDDRGQVDRVKLGQMYPPPSRWARSDWVPPVLEDVEEPG